MQAEKKFDQAEGLRRLLVRPSLRVVTIVGARQGLGATSVVVNLAVAMSRAGKQVLVLDENLAPDNVAQGLGLKPRFDLLNAIRNELTWREVLLQARNGVSVLPVARAMQTVNAMNEVERERLLECLNAASWGMDAVLVDACTDGNSVCAGLSGDEPLLLVVNATTEGITESYALLKQLAAQTGRRTFDLVFNKTSSEQQAHTVFDNMQLLAQTSLQVTLQYMGHIPKDGNMLISGKAQRALLDMMPASPASRALAEMAEKLILQPPTEQEGCNTLNHLMQRLLQQKPARRVMLATR